MLIGSEAKLTRKLMKSMEDLPPSRLQLVRQKSAWCNAANLVDYFRKLQVALAPYMEILRPVVVLDVIAQPFARSSHARCARMRVGISICSCRNNKYSTATGRFWVQKFQGLAC